MPTDATVASLHFCILFTQLLVASLEDVYKKTVNDYQTVGDVFLCAPLVLLSAPNLPLHKPNHCHNYYGRPNVYDAKSNIQIIVRTIRVQSKYNSESRGVSDRFMLVKHRLGPSPSVRRVA